MPNISGSGAQIIFVSAGDHDVRPCLCKTASDGLADSFAAAGNEGDAATKIEQRTWHVKSRRSWLRHDSLTSRLQAPCSAGPSVLNHPRACDATPKSFLCAAQILLRVTAQHALPLAVN